MSFTKTEAALTFGLIAFLMGVGVAWQAGLAVAIGGYILLTA